MLNKNLQEPGLVTKTCVITQSLIRKVLQHIIQFPSASKLLNLLLFRRKFIIHCKFDAIEASLFLTQSMPFKYSWMNRLNLEPYYFRKLKDLPALRKNPKSFSAQSVRFFLTVHGTGCTRDRSPSKPSLEVIFRFCDRGLTAKEIRSLSLMEFLRSQHFMSCPVTATGQQHKPAGSLTPAAAELLIDLQ